MKGLGSILTSATSESLVGMLKKALKIRVTGLERGYYIMRLAIEAAARADTKIDSAMAHGIYIFTYKYERESIGLKNSLIQVCK